MGIARYDIVPVGKQWAVRHDGIGNLEYSTKEAAFESLAATASMAIREGHEVQINVPRERQSER
jgi:hypothetical protein